ncbi:MAG: hypothetical protein R3B09_35960 [Nannocystaceae bacterium]
MTPRQRAVLVASLLAGLATAGGTYLVLRANQRVLPLPAPRSNIVPIITPVIYPDVAGAALSQLRRLSEDEHVTVVLHTLGGCMVSSVMIADALRRFRSSTAVVPYMALSGGTIIALSAQRIELGRNAALSAVDPMIGGVRARHIGDDDPSLRDTAREYETAIRRYVHETLALHLQSPEAVDRALTVFMGEEAPHEWPIRAPELAALGLDIGAADPGFADLVDAYSRRAG